jgi:Tol biopolymer transport system component
LSNQASPNGKWVAIQINCEAGGYVQVLDVASGSVLNLGGQDSREGEFLEWTNAEDELLILIHGLVSNQVHKVNVRTQSAETLSVPGIVYDLTMSPDRQRMIYSTTKGIGFGSETWVADADGSNPQLLFSEPQHLTIFPRWSPNGKALTYIRLIDSSTPFVVGELWLADQDGSSKVLLSEIDAGHGYKPTWSPDSTRIAFVKRENPNDKNADVVPEYLVSNVYIADLQANVTINISDFSGANAEQPIWSPDGAKLAFGVKNIANSGLWQFDFTTRDLHQIAEGEVLGNPLWIINPTPSEISK